MLLEWGANSRWESEEGQTLLDLAIKPSGAADRGSLEIVKMLLDPGVDFNYGQGREGETAQHQAGSDLMPYSCYFSLVNRCEGFFYECLHGLR